MSQTCQNRHSRTKSKLNQSLIVAHIGSATGSDHSLDAPVVCKVALNVHAHVGQMKGPGVRNQVVLGLSWDTSDALRCCRGPVAANTCATHAASVGEGKCTRVLQVDQHALSLLEQLVPWEGQAASQHADSVLDVRPGEHGNVEHAAPNAPVTGLAVEDHHVAADSLAANCVVDEGGLLRSCGHGVVGVDAVRKDI
eukprot:6177218-Pleurochrysis_carterae.AAC.3